MRRPIVVGVEGANVNATTPSGETALGHARVRGTTPLVDLLLKAGAKLRRVSRPD